MFGVSLLFLQERLNASMEFKLRSLPRKRRALKSLYFPIYKNDIIFKVIFAKFRMRKIVLKKNLENKSKRNTIIFSIIMLFLLVISTAGYAFMSGSKNSKETKDKDSKIQQIGNYWVLTLDGEKIYFSSSPEDVKDIEVSMNSINLNTYKNKPLYIDSENQGITNEIGSSLGKYAERTQLACYRECERDLPLKTCSDNLIIWKESEENHVYQNKSCVFIEGDMKAVDAFLYKLFNI